MRVCVLAVGKEGMKYRICGMKGKEIVRGDMIIYGYRSDVSITR